MHRRRAERARILVVDSPEFGEVNSTLLRSTPELDCVGVASDWNSAQSMLATNRPEAVILGVEPSQAESLRSFETVLASHPIPVLALTDDRPASAELTLNALEHGALDFVVRPRSPQLCDFRLRDELRVRLRGLRACDLQSQLGRQEAGDRLAGSRLQTGSRDAIRGGQCPSSGETEQRIVVVGAGVGGPRALLRLFRQLRAPLPPMVVAQNLPANFIEALSHRLNALSPVRCKVAETGDTLQPNTAYFAPARQQTVVVRSEGRPTLLVHSDERSNPLQPSPSVDVLMQSAAMAFGSKCLGVLLTGNGRDGVEGARAIGVAGGFVLGQDARSSFASGTTRLALALNYIDRQFHLDDVAEALNAVSPYLGRPEIAVVRSPIVDPGPLHACAS